MTESKHTPLPFRMENRPRLGRVSHDGGKTWQDGDLLDTWWIVEIASGQEYLAANHQMGMLWAEYERVRNSHDKLVKALQEIARGDRSAEWASNCAELALHEAGEEL